MGGESGPPARPPRARALPFKATALGRTASLPAAKTTNKQPTPDHRGPERNRSILENESEAEKTSASGILWRTEPGGRNLNDRDDERGGAGNGADDEDQNDIDLFSRSNEYFGRFVEDNARQDQKSHAKRKSLWEENEDQTPVADEEDDIQLSADVKDDLLSEALNMPARGGEGASDSSKDELPPIKRQKRHGTGLESPQSMRNRDTTSPVDNELPADSQDTDLVRVAETPENPTTISSDEPGMDLEGFETGQEEPAVQQTAAARTATKPPISSRETIMIEDDDPFADAPVPLPAFLPAPLPASPPAQKPSEEPQDEFQRFIDRAQKQASGQDLQLVAQEESHSVLVYVSSRVAGTAPFTARVRLSNKLKLLRDQWCKTQRQNMTLALPEGAEEGIILSWRSRRIYNFHTLYLLGIRVQDDGIENTNDLTLYHKDSGALNDPKEGFRSNCKMVHIEAWTTEAWDSFQRELQNGSKQRSLDDMDNQNEGSAQEEPEEAAVRVVLRSKDFPELKISARPTTTMETLVAKFRNKTNLESNKQIILLFDGERLAEHTTLQDADITDLDIIEVHLK